MKWTVDGRKDKDYGTKQIIDLEAQKHCSNNMRRKAQNPGYQKVLNFPSARVFYSMILIKPEKGDSASRHGITTSRGQWTSLASNKFLSAIKNQKDW